MEHGIKKLFPHLKEHGKTHKRIPTPDWHAWYFGILIFVAIFLYYGNYGCFFNFFNMSETEKEWTLEFCVFITIISLAEWEIVTNHSRTIKGLLALCLLGLGYMLVGPDFFEGVSGKVLFLGLQFSLPGVMYVFDDMASFCAHYFIGDSEEDSDDAGDVDIEELKRLSKLLDECKKEIMEDEDAEVLPDEEEIERFLKDFQKKYALFLKTKTFGMGYNRNLSEKVLRFVKKADYYERLCAQYARETSNCEALATYFLINMYDYPEFACFSDKKLRMLLRLYAVKGVSRDEIQKKVFEIEERIEA